MSNNTKLKFSGYAVEPTLIEVALGQGSKRSFAILLDELEGPMIHTNCPTCGVGLDFSSVPRRLWLLLSEEDIEKIVETAGLSQK